MVESWHPVVAAVWWRCLRGPQSREAGKKSNKQDALDARTSRQWSSRSKTEELPLAKAQRAQRKRIEMDFPWRSWRLGERNPDSNQSMHQTAYAALQPLVMAALGGKTMRTIVTFYSVLAICLGALADTKISVSDLNPPSRVKGRLGRTLGNQTIIEGVRAERVKLGNPLLVSVVDDDELKQPIAIEIRGNIKIEKNKRYRLEGYESGAFGASPDWTVGNNLPQQPFQFYSFFIVTRVIQPQSE